MGDDARLRRIPVEFGCDFGSSSRGLGPGLFLYIHDPFYPGVKRHVKLMEDGGCTVYVGKKRYPVKEAEVSDGNGATFLSRFVEVPLPDRPARNLSISP